MALRLVTAPTSEPVTLTELKALLRVDTSDEDTLLATLLTAARQYAEEFQNRACVPQTWDLSLDCFPALIRLPRAPLASVTSITYLDGDGASQTLAANQYRVDTATEPGRVTPAYGVSWPATQTITNAVVVRFVAGWASAALVPAPIKHAIALLVSHWFEHREPALANGLTELPFAVESLLWQHRLLEAV
jgi:uncharacterized phiE125 gp8 family phage protein